MTAPDTNAIRTMADAMEATIRRSLVPDGKSAEAEAMRDLCDALDEARARADDYQRRYATLFDRTQGTPCEQIRHAQEVETLRAENERLRYVLDGVAGAIDTGRNEPLQIWRDQINIARAALAQTEEG